MSPDSGVKVYTSQGRNSVTRQKNTSRHLFDFHMQVVTYYFMLWQHHSVNWLIDWNGVLSRFNSISVISRLGRHVARSAPHLHQNKNTRYWSRNLSPDQTTRVTDILGLNLSTRTWTDGVKQHAMMCIWKFNWLISNTKQCQSSHVRDIHVVMCYFTVWQELLPRVHVGSILYDIL